MQSQRRAGQMKGRKEIETKGRVEKKDKKTVGIEDAWAGGRWD